ncbi:MAG: hypothetical protein KBT21_10630 [Treponema sp.]|nr:hypothetical protein [Candidatus Treponema merdequi]
MFKILRRVIEETRREKRERKAKSALLQSEITEQFVEDLFKIADEHPNTQVIIEPVAGGKITIKSRLTDSDLYSDDELYKIPEITRTISIANAVRGKRK